MIGEPRLAGMLGGFALIDRLARGTAQAVNNQECSGTEEAAADQAYEPVGSVLAAMNGVERGTDDTDACRKERQTEEHGIPAVDCDGALYRMVQ
jgi:hypothetical protein